MSQHNCQNSQPRATQSMSRQDYFCCNKKNMKEVNSLSRQDTEVQHKKNGDKEIIVATKSRVAAKTCVSTKKFYVATIKAKEL